MSPRSLSNSTKALNKRVGGWVADGNLTNSSRHDGLKGSRVLITGITGFVGPHLAKALLGRGATVYGLVRRRSDGNLYRGLTDLKIESEVKVIEGSTEDLTSLLTALDRSEPDYIYHLAAQSFVERSFLNPLETFHANATGTTNLLEAIRIKDRISAKFIYAGSSEEYGLVISSRSQLQKLSQRSAVFPHPTVIPELPVKETNPLRPMSPYAVTKVFGEHITLNFQRSYGLKGLVSRAFNHEGSRRGASFVTSTIARQAMRLKYGEQKEILIGNLNPFRDWSHVDDVVEGYLLLAEKGAEGEVYNLGSERANSIATYLLWSLEEAGFATKRLHIGHGRRTVNNPSEMTKITKFGKQFQSSRLDQLLLDEEIEFLPSDERMVLVTNKGEIRVLVDKKRLRPAEVPILLSDASKAKREIGFRIRHSVKDIIVDQLNYYADAKRR